VKKKYFLKKTKIKTGNQKIAKRKKCKKPKAKVLSNFRDWEDRGSKDAAIFSICLEAVEESGRTSHRNLGQQWGLGVL
jgi:hypothetical protein